MYADNDNTPARDYFMPKLSPWRWVWAVLIVFGLPVAALTGLIRLWVS